MCLKVRGMHTAQHQTGLGLMNKAALNNQHAMSAAHASGALCVPLIDNRITDFAMLDSK